MCQKRFRKKFPRIQDSTVADGDSTLSTFFGQCPKLYITYTDNGRKRIHPPKYLYSSYSKRRGQISNLPWLFGSIYTNKVHKCFNSSLFHLKFLWHVAVYRPLSSRSTQHSFVGSTNGYTLHVDILVKMYNCMVLEN